MMDQIGIMSAPRAIGWAAVVAGLFAAAIFCIAMPGYGFAGFLAIALAGALPIALAHAGFIAPLIARPLIGARSVGWSNAVVAGVLVAIAPAAVCVLIEIPFSLNEDRDMPFADWLGALAILAVAGVIGGLVFRTLYGPRRLPGTTGRK